MSVSTQTVDQNGVKALLRPCWILVSDKRKSGPAGWTTEPTIYSLVVEWIQVDADKRRQGLCKQFLELLFLFSEYEMIVVERVQNPILADALTRWGWECDRRVMDFYKRSNYDTAHSGVSAASAEEP